jgi:SAM-dependent methyltransferase
MNRRGWDTISTRYQASTRITTDDVHYGPLAPGERELGLLGDVSGKRILQIGCGGGQKAIALARWGATCTGLDPSAAQLDHARQLALAHAVDVEFVRGVGEDLSHFPDRRFDITLSSCAFDYVGDLQLAYSETSRVLREGGAFVFCLSHPWFQAVGWHLAGDPDAPDVSDHASWPAIDEWDWTFADGTSAPMCSPLRTVAQIVNVLIVAGFVLERLVEQAIEDVAAASQEELARLPYVSGYDPGSPEYQIMHKLPRTLILRARKEETGGR